MRIKIVLTILCLILTTAPAIFAQPPDSTIQVDTLHPKILEERIKALDAKIEKIDAERTRELDQRVQALDFQVEERTDGLEKLMDQYVWGIGLVATALVVMLTFFGFPAIQKYIQGRIDGEVESKVKGLEGEIKEKGEAAVDKLVEDAKLRLVEADKAQSEYEKLRDQLKEVTESRRSEEPIIEELKQKLAEANDLNAPMAEDLKLKFAEFELKLSNLKEEALYTAEEWSLKGQKAQGQCNYAEAVDHYTKAVAIDPRHLPSYEGLSSCYHELHDYENALMSSDQAIAIAPHIYTGYNNRGCSLNKLGRYEEGLRTLDKSVELAPVRTYPTLNRSVSLMGLGRYDEALAGCDRVLELNPDHPAADLVASQAKLLLAQYEAAVGHAKTALSLSTLFKHRALALYLICLNMRILGRTSIGEEAALQTVLNERFTAHWYLDLIEDWVKTADIPEDARKFIIEKTELMKANQKKKE